MSLLLKEPLRTRLKENPGDSPYWLISDLELYFKRSLSNIERDEEIVEKVNEGAYDFGQLINTDQVDIIRSDIESRLSDEDRVNIREFKGYEVRRDLPIEVEEVKDIDGIEQLLDHPELVEKLQGYFGTDFELTTGLVIHYQNIPEEELGAGEGLTRDWHLDTSAGSNEVRLLFFLTDQEEKGAFEAVGIRNTVRLLEKYGYDELRENPDLVNEDEIKSYKGKRGTALLSNVVEQIHRGRGPEEGDSRILLLLTFAPE